MSLAATVINDFRVPYKDTNLDAYEHKMQSFGILETVKADTPNLLNKSQIEQAKKATTHTVNVPVINRGSVTISNTRTCNIQSGGNTSALVPITWKTYSFGIYQRKADFYNNELGKQDDFNRQMENGLRDLVGAIEVDMYAALEAAKSQINAAVSSYTFTGNALQVPSTDDHFLNKFKATMSENKFSGPYSIVANPWFEERVNRVYAQGRQNAENTAYQFGGFNFAYSHTITPDQTAGLEKQVEGFLMPRGSIGMLSWVRPDQREGEVAGSKEWFETEVMPILGEKMGAFYRKDCVDGGTGNENVVGESWELSIDVAIPTFYNSTPGTEQGPIFKFEIPQA